MVNNFISFASGCDRLAILMIALCVFMGLCVGSFAARYMKGDSQYHSFFIQLILLIISVSGMASSDNLILFLIAWCLSSLVLVRLMIHKPNWRAAKASGIMAAKNYALNVLCMGAAFLILYLATGETSINAINHQDAHSLSMQLALILILLAAMMLSAIWPFHRWLISSLNSPTPVSAVMHAGLVNGGGFLLVRFAPLYLQHPPLLTLIFVIGLVTALLGTWWKLMQSDVKRMLACSTMGQMGFMIAQCGLGLFPAAVAHLIWHGMFKAHLFLGSGSAAQEKRFDLGYPPKPLTFICALVCGLTGSLAFAWVSNKSWLVDDTTLVLLIITFMAGSQFALPMVRFKPLGNLPLAFIFTGVGGLLYGFSVQIIAWLMEPMGLMQPQPLNGIHIIGILVLTLAWLSILFLRSQEKTMPMPGWALRAYVAALNSSQPHPSTVTAHRNQYQY